MVEPRRTRFSREGWYFLFVLSFIIGGAVLREVNLLIMLAGLMVGLLLFNWRFSSKMIQRLTVRRRLPLRACAGDVFKVDITVENSRRWLAGWAIAVEDRIQQQEPDRSVGNVRSRVILPYIRPQSSDRATYLCRIPQRGVYKFGPLQVSSRFPLGFVQTSRNVSQFSEVTVFPKLGRLTSDWSRLMESAVAGDEQSHVNRGMTEGDYYGLRDWKAGDNQRWIHWRASAKLNELKVREFEQRKNRKLTLVLDLWQPVDAANEFMERIESLLSFAATVVAHACQQGEAYISFKAIGKPDFDRSGNASPALRQDVLDYLAIVEGTASDRLQEVLQQTLVQSAPRSRTVILSTRSREQFVGNGERLEANAAVDTDPRWLQQLAQITWVQADSPEQSRYFELNSPIPEQGSREDRAVTAN